MTTQKGRQSVGWGWGGEDIEGIALRLEQLMGFSFGIFHSTLGFMHTKLNTETTLFSIIAY